MIDRVDALAQAVADLVVGLDAGREHVGLAVFLHRRRIHDALRDLEALDHRIEIVDLAEEVRIDARRCVRIGAGDRDGAPALRPQQADMARIAVAPMLLARMVVDHADDEMQLDVGRGQVALGLQECAGFGEIGRHCAVPLALVALRRRCQLAESLHRIAEKIGVVRAVAEGEVGVVLQVPADAGQMMRDGNAGLLQFVAVADARPQEDRRRSERAGGHDHLAPRAQGLFFLADTHHRAGRPAVLDRHAVDRRAGEKREIAAVHIGMDEGAGGAAALAVDLRHLIDAAAFLLRAVEILDDRQLRLARRIEEDLLEGIFGARRRDIQRAALAVEGVGDRLVVLGFPEVGQHVVIGPAGISERGPMVVVGAVAADIDHRIDGGRAAERLAARLVADTAAEARLGHRIVGPVVDLRRNHRSACERRADHPATPVIAGLDKRDRDVRVLAQPARDDATGGAAAQHNKIEVLHDPSEPLSGGFAATIST